MILKLNPNIQRKIWGGQKLAKLKNIRDEKGLDPIGETWEISQHPDGLSLLSDGSTLDLKQNKDKLPYLVKLIDTGDELSIQVHPDDEYALLHENSRGKAECWIILDVDESLNAGVYLGLKAGVSKEIFLKALEDNSSMNELLNFYKAEIGDFFFVPAGTIHAIGRGVTLAEVQQSSGITYRVWDWNRVDSNGKKRELHVKKSLDVINFEEHANLLSHFSFQKNIFSHVGIRNIIKHHSFSLKMGKMKGHESVNITMNPADRIPSLLVLKGSLLINQVRITAMNSVLLIEEKNIQIDSEIDSEFLLIE
jgi:mannose-6-phosphate isomerase